MTKQQDIFIASALSAEQIALAIEESSDLLMDELWQEDPFAAQILLEDNTAERLRNTSAYLLEAAQKLSGSESRGPYNHIAKVNEWFPKALSWPDKEFRHSFRSVSLDSHN
jgi:hypothetical protein